MSAFVIHQPTTQPQIIDSRGGLLWCKMGLGCEYGKVNFYLKQPPFAPVFGLFAAKRTAFWYKIHCVLLLNTLRFGAKCKVKWCKMQCKVPLNAKRCA